ncbi:acyl-CoA dehydrogenase [Sphingorhabdus lutea]|uniref:Acyl-CoA dehydrogenase n=2 Tax=Sphingorhabdus lutea TaxID=1913578 RepID=A0A1L3JF09_9SPHN|nr:acyl-CoA dehydrogenase [Sphingorhabdus lutea]
MEFPSISYSEEQIELGEVAGAFCRDKSPIDKVRSLIDSSDGYDQEIYAEMAQMGWMGVGISEQFGGIGLGLGELAAMVEQMGRHLMAGPFVTSHIAAQMILAGNDDAQKSLLLPRIIGGEVASLALIEQEGDWNLDQIKCTATINGEMLQLSGTKNFVMWAQAADFILVNMMMDNAPVIIWVNRHDLDNAAMRREIIIDETKRSASINFDGVTIPKSQILKCNDVPAILARIELVTNLLQSAEMAGGTHRVIDYTLEYLRTRKQFGKIIGEYQALKHPMVNEYAAFENARSLMLSAAANFGQMGNMDQQRQGEIAVRMAKAATEKSYSSVSDRAIQFHGGFGFTHDCDAGLHRRAAIFHASQFGDAIWQRQKLRDLLFG